MYYYNRYVLQCECSTDRITHTLRHPTAHIHIHITYSSAFYVRCTYIMLYVNVQYVYKRECDNILLHIAGCRRQYCGSLMRRAKHSSRVYLIHFRIFFNAYAVCMCISECTIHINIYITIHARNTKVYQCLE